MAVATERGGACESTGLSTRGLGILGDLQRDAVAATSDLLLVGDFEGMGAASMSLEEVIPGGAIVIEKSPIARAVLRS